MAARPGRVPPAGQAAQHHAHEVLGLLSVDDLPVTAIEQMTLSGAVIERRVVTLDAPGGPVVVAVESRPSDPPDRLTCRATHPAHSRTWHPLSISGPAGPSATR